MTEHLHIRIKDINTIPAHMVAKRFVAFILSIFILL